MRSQGTGAVSDYITPDSDSSQQGEEFQNPIVNKILKDLDPFEYDDTDPKEFM